MRPYPERPSVIPAQAGIQSPTPASTLARFRGGHILPFSCISCFSWFNLILFPLCLRALVVNPSLPAIYLTPPPAHAILAFACGAVHPPGGMAERFIAAVLKTVDRKIRGFESLSLRLTPLPDATRRRATLLNS